MAKREKAVPLQERVREIDTSKNSMDLQFLVAIGEAFWRDAPYQHEYNPTRVKALCKDMAENHYLRVVEGRDDTNPAGVIGFMIHPLIFDDRISVATEIFFWMHPDMRDTGAGRYVLTQAEEDLREMGVQIICMGDMMTSMDMEAFYRTEGYTLTERSYTKELY